MVPLNEKRVIDMVSVFRIEQSRKTRSRKLPWLPRVGFVLDIGGRRISYRQAPVLETLFNLLERGASKTNLNKIIAEQLYEICLPTVVRRKTVDVKAKTLSTKPKRLR